MTDPPPTENPSPGDEPPQSPPQPTPGGPYFGRLLVVLFAAVAFCGFMTWLLSTIVSN